MEKALERRLEAEVFKGKHRAEVRSAADEFLDEFTSQFPAIDANIDAEQKPNDHERLLDGVGMDFDGTSYNDETAQSDPEKAAAAHADMLDIILADDALTDELIERLVARYKEKDN